MNRWGLFKAKLEAQGIELPKLHLSCDSGYSDKELAEACEKNDLSYISVPKKNHYFEIDGKRNTRQSHRNKIKSFTKYNL
ncbi:MAG: transposase [Planktothrix sp.]